MSSVKDESEGEGEKMSQGSNESNQSSASCDSSVEHTDSDNLAKMDVDECKRLYRERITQSSGKSEIPSTIGVKENMKTKTRAEVVGILKQYRLQNFQNKYQAKELAALQNFESEKRLIWDCSHNDLQEKIRRLEEDRNNLDIHADLWLNTTGRRYRNHSERRRAVSVAGPYIVYIYCSTTQTCWKIGH